MSKSSNKQRLKQLKEWLGYRRELKMRLKRRLKNKRRNERKKQVPHNDE